MRGSTLTFAPSALADWIAWCTRSGAAPSAGDDHPVHARLRDAPGELMVDALGLQLDVSDELRVDRGSRLELDRQALGDLSTADHEAALGRRGAAGEVAREDPQADGEPGEADQAQGDHLCAERCRHDGALEQVRADGAQRRGLEDGRGLVERVQAQQQLVAAVEAHRHVHGWDHREQQQSRLPRT
jgi:hypothetical protein